MRHLINYIIDMMGSFQPTSSFKQDSGFHKNGLGSILFGFKKCGEMILFV